MERIGIIGQGFVGNAVRLRMRKYFNVFAYDKDPNKFKNTGSIKAVCDQANIIFVCVPTPMKKSGQCDTSIVQSILEIISNCGSKKVMIKSTIPPGSTTKFSEMFPNLTIAFNPEFLTEANAVEDYNNQKRIIIGAKNECSAFINVFQKSFPEAKIVVVSPEIAEMTKYLINTFLATKVSFANEIYDICQALNINYNSVISTASFDERLGKSHWLVPGPDGDRGYGGHCLVKDIGALSFEAPGAELLKAVIKKNDSVRTNRDWEKQIGRAVTE